jgi:hypothetical protein
LCDRYPVFFLFFAPSVQKWYMCVCGGERELKRW